MKHLFTTWCLAASALTVQAQVRQTLTSPNGQVKIEINADKKLVFNVIDNGKTLLQGEASMLLEGTKASQYISTSTQSAKEHFDAPNYKITSFDDEYNQMKVKNKNGVNVEFRAYNSGVAYRFITTSSKGRCLDHRPFNLISFGFLNYSIFSPLLITFPAVFAHSSAVTVSDIELISMTSSLLA